MAQVYTFDAQGGFICGDTSTEMTSYAYPTSTYAAQAKRNPVKVATEMLAYEHPSYRRYDSIALYDRRNWERLNTVRFAPAEG